MRPHESDRLSRRLLFATGVWQLTEQQVESVAEVARYLLAQRDLDHVLVEGHADRVGSSAYNLELSRKRARAVVDALTAQGLRRHQIRHIAYGFEHPYVRLKANLPAARAEDRRVELVVFRTPGR